MPCPPLVPISIIPPVSQGPSPILWQNGNQITRLNTPLNPSWLVYDGNTTRWGDGSAQAPVYLPNLQQVTTSGVSFYVGLNPQGQLVSTPLISATTTNNISGGAAGEIVYQIATNTTGFTQAGINGQLLQSNGTSSPTWLSQGTSNQLLQSNGSGTSSTWISPSNLSVTATGSTTSRTLANRFADVINVKDFGATGNGTTDDTSAIQAAINSGSLIFFPSGTYLVSTINVGSNKKLQGSGNSSIISFSNASSVGINISNANFVDLSDLAFQDGSSRTEDSVLVYNSSNVTFFKCNWLQQGNQYISLHIKSCNNVLIQDCTAFSSGIVGYAILIDGSSYASNNITLDNFNSYGYYNGVQTRWVNNLRVANSYFTNAGATGFSISPSSSRVIYGLTITENTNSVVFVNTNFVNNIGSGLEIVNNGNVKNVSISNTSSISNNGSSSYNSSGFYVSNINASYISCSAQINNNYASGVFLERGNNISFTGCIISGNGLNNIGNGIDIISGVTYVSFSNNTIACQTGSVTSGQNYGINSTANIKILIVGNQFPGGTNWYNTPSGGSVTIANNQ